MGTRTHPHPRRLRLDQRAVSPVIGTVLVLFIVLVAMAGILAWGVPAIQGLQDHAEFRSVQTQMVQADHDMRVLRNPQNNRISHISMNEGILRMSEGSRWAVSVALDPAYSAVRLDGWEAGASATLQYAGMPTQANVTADRVVGGTFTNAVTANNCQDCPLALGFQVDDNTTRVQIREDATLMLETWIFETGRLSYFLSVSDTTNRLHIEMGAVFAQQGTQLFLEETPTIKEPVFDVEPKDTTFLFRAIQLEGNSTASGKGRHTVQSNLVDTYGLTRGRPHFEAARSVHIQIDDGGAAATAGTLESGFCNQFLRRSYYTEANADCGDGDVSVFYDPPDGAATNNGLFLYEFSQSVVNVNVRPF